MASRKCPANSRAKPFEPGKPKGSRQKTALLAEQPIQADAGAIAQAIVRASATGELSAVQRIAERLMPAPRDAKLDKLAQRAEEAVLKAFAAGKLAVADARHLLRLASEIRNNPLFRLTDLQRRAAIVEIGMVRGDSIDDMLAELELNDDSWSAANESVPRETWEAIDAYYGFVVPASPQSSQRSAKK